MNDEILDRFEIEIDKNKKKLYKITGQDIQIILNNEMIKNIHNLYKVEGNFVLFNRVRKSYCKLCKDEHISDNVYCSVNEVEIKLYCRRFDLKNNKKDYPSLYIILGNKEKQEQFNKLKYKYKNISYYELLHLLDKNNITLDNLKKGSYYDISVDITDNLKRLNLDLETNGLENKKKVNNKLQYSKEEIEKWFNSINGDYSINPKTNKKIKKQGKIHKIIEKQYKYYFENT